jgi:hypothetical protein
MSFSQMTTAAFSSGRKNVEELLATARKIFLGGSGSDHLRNIDGVIEEKGFS